MTYLKSLALGAIFAAAFTPIVAAQADDAPVITDIDFGNDAGRWANDGECDDPRFQGDGVAGVLLDDDRLRDATDCREAFDAGTITLIDTLQAAAPPLRVDSIQFGSDVGNWANDGECDDPRFAGDGMAHGDLQIDDAYADATDCLAHWQAGTLTYNPDWRAERTPPPTAAEIDLVDFGQDTSEWRLDMECDDPRFQGPGMAGAPRDIDRMADATDCRYLFMLGEVTLID